MYVQKNWDNTCYMHKSTVAMQVQSTMVGMCTTLVGYLRTFIKVHGRIKAAVQYNMGLKRAYSMYVQNL